MNRKVFSFLALIAIAFALVSACSKKQERAVTSPVPPEIKIVAIWESTGELANLGAPAQKATQLAFEEYQRRPGVPKVRLEYQDSQSTPQGAVSAFNASTTGGAPIAIIGPLTSPAAMAITPLVNEAKVVLMTTASTPAFTSAGEYAFRIYPSDSFEAKVMADHIRGATRHRRIAIVYPQNDYGIGLEKAFRDAAGAELELVGSEPYPNEQAEFHIVARRVRQLRPDAIYAPGYPAGVGLLVKALRRAGLRQPVFSSLGIEDPQLFKYAGSAADGIVYTVASLPPSEENSRRAAFEKAFKAKFNEDASFPSLYGYDVANTILDAIAAGARTADDLKRAFAAGTVLTGATGSFQFDANGDVVRPYSLKTVSGRRFDEFPNGKGR